MAQKTCKNCIKLQAEIDRLRFEIRLLREANQTAAKIDDTSEIILKLGEEHRTLAKKIDDLNRR